jgi:hypothetical protein
LPQSAVRAGVVAARFVEHPEGELVPAVVHIVEDGPVRLRRIDRREQTEIGPELDAAAGISGRECIRSTMLRLAGSAGIQLVEDPAIDPLVRTALTKGSPLGQRSTFGNLKPDDLRVQMQRSCCPANKTHVSSTRCMLSSP